jgi:hypothetical protein
VVKGSANAERDRLLAAERGVEPADDALVERRGDPEGGSERHGRDQEPATELVEMNDELRAFAVTGTGGGGTPRR